MERIRRLSSFASIPAAVVVAVVIVVLAAAARRWIVPHPEDHAAAASAASINRKPTPAKLGPNRLRLMDRLKPADAGR